MFSGVQALTDEDLQALSSLVRLRELSLSGAMAISGTGLTALNDLPHLQVHFSALILQPKPPYHLLLAHPCLHSRYILAGLHPHSTERSRLPLHR